MAKQVNGNQYLNKIEALNELEQMRKIKKPLRGIELYAEENGELVSHYEKTIWFKTQRLCYSQGKGFLQKQMIAQWQWAEFKL
jgi:hypothetical protein